MPLPYDLRKFGMYLALTLVLMAINHCLVTPWVWLNYLIKIGLLLVYVVYMIRQDLPLYSLPFIGKYFSK